MVYDVGCVSYTNDCVTLYQWPCKFDQWPCKLDQWPSTLNQWPSKLIDHRESLRRPIENGRVSDTRYNLDGQVAESTLIQSKFLTVYQNPQEFHYLGGFQH